MGDAPIKTVCFTGHRDIIKPHALRLPAMLNERICALVDRGARDFRAGGALGFDMVAALKVLELRETLPIRLVLCLPCRDQTRGWSEAGCRAYRYILDRADEIHYTADRYTPTCMLERDRALVDGSDVCIAYCVKNRGGAFYTCSYALKRDVTLINLADELPPLSFYR
ncbi:MAG: DUF1273 family protein [Clostridia bacterium]|nr:DUF1273 family protein [Clostridia bacterium]